MNELPDYQPTIVPMGEYIARIKTEVTEKTSQFDTTKTYRELGLRLKNENGEYFDYNWTFNAKTPVYKNLLLILGGKEQTSGVVKHPKTYIGRLFVATIIERAARNDKSRLVNEITKIMPYEEVEEPTEEEIEEGTEEDAPF